MLQRVLITGGAGFLGSWLTRSFREHGTAVRIFDSAPAPDWACGPGMEYIQGDIRDAIAVGSAVTGVEAIVHSAFASPRLPPEAIASVNIGGVRVVCAQARQHSVPRLILISSTVVQRQARVHPFLRNSPLSAMDMYRQSRTEAEQVAMEHSGADMRVAVVRPKTFIGPGRVSAFNIVFEWIRRGKPVLIMGSGSCRYQLLEIGDMAEGIRLLTGSASEGVFCFGAARFDTLREDLQSLIDHAGTGSRLLPIPSVVARLGIRGLELAGMVPPSELHYSGAWSRDSVVDTSRAAVELGWRPGFSNAEALRRGYDWYVESMRGGQGAASIHVLPHSHRMLGYFIEKFLR